MFLVILAPGALHWVTSNQERHCICKGSNYFYVSRSAIHKPTLEAMTMDQEESSHAPTKVNLGTRSSNSQGRPICEYVLAAFPFSSEGPGNFGAAQLFGHRYWATNSAGQRLSISMSGQRLCSRLAGFSFTVVQLGLAGPAAAQHSSMAALLFGMKLYPNSSL